MKTPRGKKVFRIEMKKEEKVTVSFLNIFVFDSIIYFANLLKETLVFFPVSVVSGEGDVA